MVYDDDDDDDNDKMIMMMMMLGKRSFYFNLDLSVICNLCSGNKSILNWIYCNGPRKRNGRGVRPLFKLTPALCGASFFVFASAHSMTCEI